MITSTTQFTGSVSISGSLNATSSWANNATSASYSLSASQAANATTSSYALSSTSASYASSSTSASYAINATNGFPYTGTANITGSLIINPTSSFVLPLTSSSTPSTGSAYWSGSFLFVYNGTRYMSSSFA